MEPGRRAVTAPRGETARPAAKARDKVKDRARSVIVTAPVATARHAVTDLRVKSAASVENAVVTAAATDAVMDAVAVRNASVTQVKSRARRARTTPRRPLLPRPPCLKVRIQRPSRSWA